MIHLPIRVVQPPIEVPAAPEQAEVTSVPAAAVEARPSPWATFEPQVRALAPAAMQAGGRALLNSWDAPAESGDPAVRDQVALETVRAAGSVSADSSLDGRDRLAAVVVAGGVFDGLVAAHEREAARTDARAQKLLLGAILATVAAAVAAWLGRGPR